MRYVWVVCVLCIGCGADAVTSSSDATLTPGPLMRPGENCLRCHSEGTKERAPVWTAAGTVFRRIDAMRDEVVEGVHVTVT
jgi:hypothetical protein